ncbi:hypothetical protein LZT04_01645, partial [Vibrio fluvialis]|nr:hypothetical protein [Vibrio fluvialis]
RHVGSVNGSFRLIHLHCKNSTLLSVIQAQKRDYPALWKSIGDLKSQIRFIIPLSPKKGTKKAPIKGALV